MNERIREFADQILPNEKEFHQGDPKEWGYFFSGDELEKFAELIVRECASICELNGQSYTHSFTPAKARLAESTSNHCGLMIKKHFGVEE
jgi:hypothetical protein